MIIGPTQVKSIHEMKCICFFLFCFDSWGLPDIDSILLQQKLCNNYISEGIKTALVRKHFLQGVHTPEDIKNYVDHRFKRLKL